jgi:hypothetical protein
VKQVVYFQLPDKILAAMPKCGWHSIRRMARDNMWPVLSPSEVYDSGLPLCVLIRHPYERILSVWAYHRNIIDRDGKSGFPQGFPDDVTVEEFINAILDGAQDPHWYPVLKGLAKEPKLVIRFEDMGSRWGEISDYPLAHLNPSPGPKPETVYRKAEVLAMYEDDYMAWYNARNPEKM